MTTAEHATYIRRRPAWADSTEFTDHDDKTAVIRHRWAVPTSGAGYIGSDGEPWPLEVEVQRLDELRVHATGVAFEEGPTEIFLADLDASFRDTAEARRFAAAIMEACDRIDGEAGDGSGSADSVETTSGATGGFPPSRHPATTALSHAGYHRRGSAVSSPLGDVGTRDAETSVGVWVGLAHCSPEASRRADGRRWGRVTTTVPAVTAGLGRP